MDLWENSSVWREVIGAQIFALSVTLYAALGKKTCLASIFLLKNIPSQEIQAVSLIKP